MLRSLIKRLWREPPRIIAGSLLFASALILDLCKIEILPTIIYIISIIFTGTPVFVGAVRGLMRRDFLDEKFLMCLASVGAVAIGEPTEGAAVMLFFLVGEYFEHRATGAARGSIKALMQILPDSATVIDGAEEREVDSEDVEVGSVILIRPGERVPIDAVILSGEAEVDSSALTGESLPRPVGVGDEIDSGSVLLGASVTARTLRPAEDSRASRILALVEEASDRKSREESFITAFSRYYTPIVIGLAALMALIPSLCGWLGWQTALYRALSFLVVSCPCALVISVPMAFFGGIGAGARCGVLYKGGNVFSSVAHPARVVFDKTGTLTTGEFELIGIAAVGMSEGELLRLVASAEHNSNHPIARGICRAAAELVPAESLEELPGKGIVAVVGGRRVAVGNAALMAHEGAAAEHPEECGRVYAAVDGAYAGALTLRDAIKPEAAAAIAELRRLGVARTYILSGDREKSVAPVAGALGIDEARAELLPEDKYAHLDALIGKGGPTLYVGDGINDAPCLARADVGIAMGERGTDSAIESSDVVVMSDALDRIPAAVRIARRTVRIAKQNILFAIGLKALALLLVALGLVGMWLAVVADVGVAVLAILNSMRTLKVPSR